METRFGTDFSSIRIHTDDNAAQMSKELGAKAFTHGKDIYFNEGKVQSELKGRPAPLGARTYAYHTAKRRKDKIKGSRAGSSNRIRGASCYHGALKGIRDRSLAQKSKYNFSTQQRCSQRRKRQMPNPILLPFFKGTRGTMPLSSPS